MSALTKNQEIYAATLAKLTGLNLSVVRGWLLAEESGSAARARDASGNQNWLNYSAGTGPGGRFDHPEWNNNPVKAATDTASHILHSSYYKGIVASAGEHPANQIEAIASSPWDAGHYAGGSHLVSTYHLVSGLPAPKITGMASAAPITVDTLGLPDVPKMPQTIDQGFLSDPTHPFLVRRTIPLPNFDGTPVSSPTSAKIPPPPVTTPKSTPSPFTSPSDPLTGKPSPVVVPPGEKGKTAVFEGTTIAAWMLPSLQYARAHGWTGKLTSGVRSTAEQSVLYQRYKAGGNIAAKPGQSNHELQNGGAFDATDAPQLNTILSGFKGKRPIWAKSVGLNDTPHFSVNGH